jgi:hypothetical protein
MGGNEDPWLCAPDSRRVCLCRDTFRLRPGAKKSPTRKGGAEFHGCGSRKKGGDLGHFHVAFDVIGVHSAAAISLDNEVAGDVLGSNAPGTILLNQDIAADMVELDAA